MDETILVFPLERLGSLETSLTKVVSMNLLVGVPVIQL